MAFFAAYSLSGRTFELSAVRHRRWFSLPGVRQYVACWTTTRVTGGPGSKCSARWATTGMHKGNTFEFGATAALPAVGDRCTATLAGSSAAYDCVKSGQFKALDSRFSRLHRPLGMTLQVVDIGAGPVRLTAGPGTSCEIRHPGGSCTLSGGRPGAHVTVKNLGTSRARVGIAIVGEADGPLPPTAIPHWPARQKPSAPAAAVATLDSACGENEYDQLGAFYDGSDLWTGCPDESSWMQALPDSTRISQLTLPGTHDTGTFGLGSSYADADTQTLELADQLNAGIRVFDVRLKDAQCAGFTCLELYHGSDATGIYFNIGGSSLSDSFMMTLSGWMNQHPSEAIVMNIQDEDSSGTKNFAQQVDGVLKSHYYNQVYWNTDGPNPTVGELRNKIYIMTQQGTAGGDYTNPPDPPSGLIWPGSTSHNSGPPFVQDNFSCPTNKWSDIKNQLQWTAIGDPYQQYAGGTYFPNNFHQDVNINFTSAECDPAEAPDSYAGGFFRAGGVSFGCTQPIDQHIGCNMFTTQYLQQNTTGPNSAPYRYGIIYSDFPGPCLIDAEISQNPGVSKVAPDCSSS